MLMMFLLGALGPLGARDALGPLGARDADAHDVPRC